MLNPYICDSNNIHIIYTYIFRIWPKELDGKVKELERITKSWQGWMDDLVLPVMGGLMRGCMRVTSVVMLRIAVLRLPRKMGPFVDGNTQVPRKGKEEAHGTDFHYSLEPRTRTCGTRHASICESTAQHMPKDNQISSTRQIQEQVNKQFNFFRILR